MAINVVTIVGVGLIGGSFARALRAHGFGGEIVGVSSPRTLESARRLGIIDRADDLPGALAKADLVYLAQPVSRILELLPAVRSLIRPDTLVTDAGSTKEAIVDRASAVFTERPWFVGGHPMAGKSGRGVELSDAGLFRDATYVLTPVGAALPACPAVEEFIGWIQKIGAHPLVLPAKLHDEAVAWTSHLPQLVSSALAVCLVENLPSEDHLRIAGSGLRDMTRLAESPFGMWRDIFATNRENLDRALERLIGLLEQFRSDLPAERLGRQFELAQGLRQKLLTKPNS